MNERIVSHVLGLSFLLSVILAGGCMSSPPEKTEMQGTPSEIMIKNISVDDYSVKGEIFTYNPALRRKKDMDFI